MTTNTTNPTKSAKGRGRSLPLSLMPLPLLLSLLLSAGAIQAKSGREIIEQSDALPKGGTMQASMALVIEKGGTREIKEFVSRSKRYGKATRLRVSFKKPTRIEFLSHSAPGVDTSQWIKLSGPVVRRIASGEKSSSFVNSHFYYGDMEERNIDDYTYKFLEETRCGEDQCDRVRATKIKGEKIYSYVDLYIRQKDHVPVRVDFYENGIHTKTLRNEKIEWIRGIPTPRKSIMERTDGTGRSILYIRSITYELPISDTIFAPDAL